VSFDKGATWDMLAIHFSQVKKIQTMTVLRSVPHEAEHQVDNFVANDRKIIISPDIMVSLVVVNQLTVSIDSLNRSELGLEDVSTLLLNMGNALSEDHVERSTCLVSCIMYGSFGRHSKCRDKS
jgi:hypothetical protein